MRFRCGCAIDFHSHRGMPHARLEHCALHGAAPRLLATLRNLLRMHDRWKDEGVSPVSEVCYAYATDARNLIAEVDAARARAVASTVRRPRKRR